MNANIHASVVCKPDVRYSRVLIYHNTRITVAYNVCLPHNTRITVAYNVCLPHNTRITVAYNACLPHNTRITVAYNACLPHNTRITVAYNACLPHLRPLIWICNISLYMSVICASVWGKIMTIGPYLRKIMH